MGLVEEEGMPWHRNNTYTWVETFWLTSEHAQNNSTRTSIFLPCMGRPWGESQLIDIRCIVYAYILILLYSWFQYLSNAIIQWNIYYIAKMSLVWIAVYFTFALIFAVALVQWKIRHTKNQLQVTKNYVKHFLKIYDLNFPVSTHRSSSWRVQCKYWSGNNRIGYFRILSSNSIG